MAESKIKIVQGKQGGIYDMKLYDMRTEYKVNPIGITKKNPRFSWKLESDVNDTTQQSYHIVVKEKDRIVWEVKEENDHHYPLHGGHGRAEKSGGCGKTDQTKQIEPQTGLQKPGEPLVHSYTSWKSPLRGTGITRIVYFIRKALKLQEQGPSFDGGNNDEGPAAGRDVFRHFLYCSKVVRLI